MVPREKFLANWDKYKYVVDHSFETNLFVPYLVEELEPIAYFYADLVEEKDKNYVLEQFSSSVVDYMDSINDECYREKVSHRVIDDKKEDIGLFNFFLVTDKKYRNKISRDMDGDRNGEDIESVLIKSMMKIFPRECEIVYEKLRYHYDNYLTTAMTIMTRDI